MAGAPLAPYNKEVNKGTPQMKKTIIGFGILASVVLGGVVGVAGVKVIGENQVNRCESSVIDLSVSAKEVYNGRERVKESGILADGAGVYEAYDEAFTKASQTCNIHPIFGQEEFTEEKMKFVYQINEMVENFN